MNKVGAAAKTAAVYFIKLAVPDSAVSRTTNKGKFLPEGAETD
ncbi:hypothetical protein [Paenibacillus turpanensis]|nr:hypothetical protein [Paenibacillus turpanensis]